MIFVRKVKETEIPSVVTCRMYSFQVEIGREFVKMMTSYRGFKFRFGLSAGICGCLSNVLSVSGVCCSLSCL